MLSQIREQISWLTGSFIVATEKDDVQTCVGVKKQTLNATLRIKGRLFKVIISPLREAEEERGVKDMIAEIVYITNLIVALRQTTEEWCELWKYYLLS